MADGMLNKKPQSNQCDKVRKSIIMQDMRFFDWLCDDDDDNNSAKPYNTFGNGSTMRVSACGNIPLLTN